MLSALESQVATLFTDAVLYGLYIATLIHCLWQLLYGYSGQLKTSHHVDWPILIMSIAIFLSTTLDTALSVRRAMLSLRQVLGGPTPNLVWSDTTMVCNRTVIAYMPHLKRNTQAILTHLQTLFADAVLVQTKSLSIVVISVV